MQSTATKQINPPIEKLCPGCNEMLPLGEFYKNSACTLGVGTTCKLCQNAAQIARRELRLQSTDGIADLLKKWKPYNPPMRDEK